jgi:putative restriction endonuclease
MKSFEKWLIKIGNREVTAKKYSSAIDSISSDMIKINLINKNLYNISSELELLFVVDKILNCTDFIEKNKKGHNMYSAALKKFMDYKKESFISEEINITADDLSFTEGKEVLKQHIIRERNRNLIKIAKGKFKKENGNKLFCEVCGFNFYEFYGELGEDFIEAHHSIPLSEIKFGDETKVTDIVMLCSNCHSMIHRKRPWLSKEDIKKLID